MTGFGAAEGAVAGGRLRLEVRTVNHRHLNVQLKAPADLMAFETDVRERLRAHFERGHAAVSIRWVEEPPAAAGVSVDTERARGVVDALRSLGKSLGIPGDVDLATVARIPDVVRVAAADTVIDQSAVLAVVDRAAAACVAMREREGAALAADLRARIARLRALKTEVAERAPARLVAERDRLSANVAALLNGTAPDPTRLAQDLLGRLTLLAGKAALVRARAPERLVAEKDRLTRNVQELAAGVALDEGRLAQEIAHIADRLDITEELVRFSAHVDAVRGSLGDGTAAVGKRLGFLLQELGRETNTIGSKANDAAIAEAVIVMKGELEWMREQIENLE